MVAASIACKRPAASHNIRRDLVAASIACKRPAAWLVAALTAAVAGWPAPAHATSALLSTCEPPPVLCPRPDAPWCPLDQPGAPKLHPDGRIDRGEEAPSPLQASVEPPACKNSDITSSADAVCWAPSQAGPQGRPRAVPEARVAVDALTAPSRLFVEEGQPIVFRVDGPRRIFARKLPPGAEFADQQFIWTPDFLQGGQTFTVEFFIPEPEPASVQTLIAVIDSIRPPEPVIVSEVENDDFVELTIEQTTDAFLDAPGYAGRRFRARVAIPFRRGGGRLPVQLRLHGFNGAPEPFAADGLISVHPHDPFNTYWWGYAVDLPDDAPTGAVPNYSQRRALHLLQWVLRNVPSADPERVFVSGESMGGTGALALGLLYARHFAGIESTVGQVIARNHRPRRVRQLSRLWGTPDANLSDGALEPMGVWDRLDLVRALIEHPEAGHQFIFTHHAKDDPVIHFGAVVLPSPEYGLSFYDALQQFHIGHYVVWDEGGHGAPDPVLPDRWWGHWDRLRDEESYLRRDLAFPAFSHSSADDDPGDGDGNGLQSWHEDRGYAGRRQQPGDTGWNGDRAGAFNRYLRWDSHAIVDRWDRFEIPIKVRVGPGRTPLQAGDPPLGDYVNVDLPIEVDVTPRRVQAFRCRPGERIRWTYGAQSGEAIADATGAVTIPQLPVDETYRRLILSRALEGP